MSEYTVGATSAYRRDIVAPMRCCLPFIVAFALASCRIAQVAAESEGDTQVTIDPKELKDHGDSATGTCTQN